MKTLSALALLVMISVLPSTGIAATKPYVPEPPRAYIWPEGNTWILRYYSGYKANVFYSCSVTAPNGEVTNVSTRSIELQGVQKIELGPTQKDGHTVTYRLVKVVFTEPVVFERRTNEWAVFNGTDERVIVSVSGTVQYSSGMMAAGEQLYVLGPGKIQLLEQGNNGRSERFEFRLTGVKKFPISAEEKAPPTEIRPASPTTISNMWWPTLSDRKSVLNEVPALKGTIKELQWDDFETDKFLATCGSLRISESKLLQRYPDVVAETVSGCLKAAQNIAIKERFAAIVAETHELRDREKLAVWQSSAMVEPALLRAASASDAQESFTGGGNRAAVKRHSTDKIDFTVIKTDSQDPGLWIETALCRFVWRVDRWLLWDVFYPDGKSLRMNLGLPHDEPPSSATSENNPQPKEK